jgi:hypothetical protein
MYERIIMEKAKEKDLKKTESTKYHSTNGGQSSRL